jgi:hypothetical protein
MFFIAAQNRNLNLPAENFWLPHGDKLE